MIPADLYANRLPAKVLYERKAGIMRSQCIVERLTGPGDTLPISNVLCRKQAQLSARAMEYQAGELAGYFLHSVQACSQGIGDMLLHEQVFMKRPYLVPLAGTCLICFQRTLELRVFLVTRSTISSVTDVCLPVLQRIVPHGNPRKPAST